MTDRSGCEGKVGYASPKLAREAMSTLPRSGRDLIIYRCELCGRWHSGNRERSPRKQNDRRQFKNWTLAKGYTMTEAEQRYVDALNGLAVSLREMSKLQKRSSFHRPISIQIFLRACPPPPKKQSLTSTWGWPPSARIRCA
jgi:hypothetical protein